MTDSQLSVLASFSTCDISDALIKSGIAKNGGYLPDINCVSHDSVPRVVGQAFTVRLVLASDETSSRLQQHYADLIVPNCVVVISSPRYLQSAVWGGLISARAKSLGAKGVIVDGRARDLGDHQKLGFPVFARGHSTLGQATFVRAAEIQSPITIEPANEMAPPEVLLAPVTIDPQRRDLVVADVDGVVIVPGDRLDEVILLCEKLVAADTKVLQDLKKGRPIGESIAAYRDVK